ncbi:hypothetical protein SDC9_157588 [bioreactor metagenome]|uniref:Uncharacterized protein n=1 Tax=bioreactor metagenome TaxID=1076179 RepID=A0A645FD46_9ZZZZ
MCVDRFYKVFDKGRNCFDQFIFVGKKCPFSRNINLCVFTTAINSCIVFIDNIFSFFAIRFHNGVLHFLNGKFVRNYVGDFEKCRLKNGVGAVAQAYFLRNIGSIDGVQCDIVGSKVFFYFHRKVSFNFFFAPNSVQKESSVFLQAFGYIVQTQVSLNVTCYKVRGGYQISRTDWCSTKTKVRTSETARFLRVVREISLRVFIGVVANNFDRVFVRSYSTIGT